MCACVFSCVSFMTAAQQEGNTHSILWPSRVLTSLPWQHGLMLSDRSDLPLTEIQLQALHFPLSLSYCIDTLTFTHWHTDTQTHSHISICPHTCFHAVKLHFNCMSSWRASRLRGPLLVRYSSRLEWDEAVWRTESLRAHTEQHAPSLLPPSLPSLDFALWLFILGWFTG